MERPETTDGEEGAAGNAAPRSPRRGRRPRVRETATILDRLEGFGLHFIAWLAGRLGVDRASAVMGWCWRKLAPFNSRHKRADAHLAAALPGLSAAERRTILDDMWDNLGRTTAEALLLNQLVAERDRFELHLEPPIGDRVAMPGGAVFATLHQGNWELAGHGISLAGYQLAAVYRPLKNPIAEAFVRERRSLVYPVGLFPSDTASALKLRSLARQGTAIGMVADLRDTTGAVLPFLGRPAYATTLPAMLARRLGLPLIAGRVLRKKGATFRIEARQIEIPVTDDPAADILEATRRLNATFDAWVRDTPGQWMWAHRKWVD